jgi:ATP-dependent DNA helicase DinG
MTYMTNVQVVLSTTSSICHCAAVPRHVDPALIEAVFAEDGPLATLMPGYRPRRAQVDMALAVGRCLDTPRGRLAVEAGTGTGKSLAYLVPALLSERRVVVATGTKALQDQLVDKDAPIAVAAVNAVLGDGAKERTVLRVKGRSNYLCKLRWENFDRQGSLGLGDSGDQTLVQLRRFANTTRTGDRAEITGLPDNFPLWAELDANKDHCLGTSCPRYDDCFLVLTRRAAEQAAVIVVNHHLLCADQRLRLESGAFDREGDGQGFGVLPVMVALIVDEAHALADVATDHFGVSLSSEDIVRFVADVRRHADSCGTAERLQLIDAMRDVEGAGAAFFAAIGTGVVKARSGPGSGLPEPSFSERAVFVPTDDTTRLGAVAAEALNDSGDVIDAARASFDDDGVESAMVKATFAGLKERSARVRAQLMYLAGPASSDRRSVCFVDKGPRTTTLVTAPIDVRAPLSATIFAAESPVVLTSATLAIGKDVSAFVQAVGLDASGADDADDAENGVHDDDSDGGDEHGSTVTVMTAVFPSPFDHARRAALYAPTSMPEPDQPGYAERFDDEAMFLAGLSGGGALFLFTSHRAMEDAARRLRPGLSSMGVSVLKQGDKPKGALLEDLRNGSVGALFATASFWEGVDVTGAALRLVVIDRLPFRVPSDPLVRARADHARSLGKDPFKDLALPEAALSLKQGAGRLLRSVDDAGGVAILDGRLRGRRDGSGFLAALPPMTRLGSKKTIAQFWVRQVEPVLGLSGGAERASSILGDDVV